MKTFLKENFFKFMEKLFVFFFLLFLNSCGADEPKQNLTNEGGRMPSYIYSPSPTQIENIFLCEGEFSEKYHNNSNCRGLNNCSTDLTNTSIENLWLNELELLEESYNKYLLAFEKENLKEAKLKNKTVKKNNIPVKKNISIKTN